MLIRVLIGLTSLLATTPAIAQCGSCTGDVNGDEVVAVEDLLDVLANWGPCRDCAADVTGDGVVDVSDLLAVLGAWGPCPPTGNFPEMWINGGACGSEPAIQVHQYDDDFYILRQSLCTDFEGPFMYLIFGEDTVLMQDTGAGGIPIGATVYGIIDAWEQANGRDVELVVSHSHGHGDHVQGDSQFNGQPQTTVIGTSQSAVAAFFGITDWPTQIVEYDLGNRIIDVIPLPGHQSAHIALYDRTNGIVFTGDTLYPGRLYISNFSQYLASITRLVDFLDGEDVCQVLGTHIEMTNTPGVDFAFGATFHPDEHPLELGREHLLELLDGLIGMQNNPVIEEHDDFIIWPF